MLEARKNSLFFFKLLFPFIALHKSTPAPLSDKLPHFGLPSHSFPFGHNTFSSPQILLYYGLSPYIWLFLSHRISVRPLLFPSTSFLVPLLNTLILFPSSYMCQCIPLMCSSISCIVPLLLISIYSFTVFLFQIWFSCSFTLQSNTSLPLHLQLFPLLFSHSLLFCNNSLLDPISPQGSLHSPMITDYILHAEFSLNILTLDTCSLHDICSLIYILILMNLSHS